jgi:hypothetical protein
MILKCRSVTLQLNSIRKGAIGRDLFGCKFPVQIGLQLLLLVVGKSPPSFFGRF